MLKSILKLDSLNITFPHFSDVLESYYKTKVTSELEHIKRANSGKLVFYSTICHHDDFSLKNYLSFDIPKCIRCLLLRLRISAHLLAIETGRYSKPKAPLEECVCRFCSNNVESEKHFMLECSGYSNLRDKYLTDSVTHDILDIDDIVNPKTHRQANKTCCYIKETPLPRDNRDTHQLNTISNGV